MRLRVFLMVLTVTLGLVLVAACGNPATNKSAAVTGEATKATTPAAAGQRYPITPEHCKIEFIGSKVTGSHNGSFQKFSGEINYTGDPTTSRVNISMDANSLTTDDPKLTEHLKTADFFDVAKFPQAKFESTAIKPGGDKGASHTVTGNLTLHGVTKSITFPATISATADAITVNSDFSINRKDFGINYAGAADNLIRDDVVLKLTIHAPKG